MYFLTLRKAMIFVRGRAMNVMPSISSARSLSLMALMISGLGDGVLRAELNAPVLSTGEFTVTWTEPSSAHERLFLLESVGASSIGRFDVTNRYSMRFCRPEGFYTYQLELCLDMPLRERNSCVPLPGKADVYVNREIPDEWYKRVRRANASSEFGHHAVQAGDGFVVLCGNTYEPLDICLIKTTHCGQKIWERQFAPGGGARPRCLLRCAETGYLIVGSVGRKLHLLRTDPSGTKIAEALLPIGEWARGESAIMKSETEFVIAGSAEIAGKQQQGILVNAVQVGQGFDVTWQAFGGKEDDRAEQVIVTDDGGYAVAGRTKSIGNGNYDVWLVRFDADGNELPQKSYGGPEYDSAQGLVQRANGGFLLAGYTLRGNQRDMYVVLTAPNGDLSDEDHFGEHGDGDQEAWAVRRSPLGGYVIAGRDDRETLLFHVDESADNRLVSREWKPFPIGYLGSAYSLELTDTEGWVAAGSAFFDDNVSPGDSCDAFLLYYKPGEWSTAYRGLFREPKGVSLFRVYRDRVLRSTPQGRELVTDIYTNSRGALITLLKHPQLMSRAQKLLAVNRAAVKDVVRGRPSVVEDPESILGFLESFVEKAEDDEIKALARRVSQMIRKQRSKGQALFGFLFRRDARSAPDLSRRDRATEIAPNTLVPSRNGS